MPGVGVLIVDDNPTNLKLVRLLLMGEGYDVRTADDAEEAIAILETFSPKVVLMDLQLPGITGLELTAQLKADPKRRDIRIVALTAYAMKGDEEKAVAAGCDGYVTKPIDLDQLVEVVASHVARTRA